MKTNRTNLFRMAVVLCLAGLIASCKDNGTSSISTPLPQVGQTITSDTLSGAVKGTMVAGHTYYFMNDITINKGDTLLMQPGAQLLTLWGPTTTNPQYSPMITVAGTLISLGTQSSQNYIGPIPANRNSAYRFGGLWGGIQGDTGSGDVILKWTHLEYAGGTPGPSADPTLYTPGGDPRYMIEFRSPNSNLILEDSWLFGSTDDCVRSDGGHVNIIRNTFESNGMVGGESFNIKNATFGNVAYNLFIGSCTNGCKIANTKGTGLECHVDCYNNTFVNTGWRQAETARAGSTDIEKGGSGDEFNNLYVNARTGFRIPSGSDVADTTNCAYGYQFYYGQAQPVVNEFYPPDGCQSPRSTDIAGAVMQNDPKFVNYNVNQFDFNVLLWPLDTAQMSLAMMKQEGLYDFHLQSGSPCIGKGTTTAFVPMTSVTNIGGQYGTTILAPDKDMGAYQSDGTGNQH
jgi:hypothetical protein